MANLNQYQPMPIILRQPTFENNLAYGGEQFGDSGGPVPDEFARASQQLAVDKLEDLLG